MTGRLNRYHRWWLDRYTLDEIRELAAAVGGPLQMNGGDRQRARWRRAQRAHRARRADRKGHTPVKDLRDLRDPQKLGTVLLEQTASIRAHRIHLADNLPRRLPPVAVEAADSIAHLTIPDFDDHHDGPMCGLPNHPDVATTANNPTPDMSPPQTTPGGHPSLPSLHPQEPNKNGSSTPRNQRDETPDLAQPCGNAQTVPRDETVPGQEARGSPEP